MATSLQAKGRWVLRCSISVMVTLFSSKLSLYTPPPLSSEFSTTKRFAQLLQTAKKHKQKPSRQDDQLVPVYPPDFSTESSTFWKDFSPGQTTWLISLPLGLFSVLPLYFPLLSLTTGRQRRKVCLLLDIQSYRGCQLQELLWSCIQSHNPL